ncbi:ferritin-like domain-containing protein [Sphingomonas sp. RHCKR47]|uniref:ferritin-like domain-containing protein n=1 Tax=Sphingomonas citricola TaxID=2862498 RepID=UPI001C67131B|nr:ferritin-like domain-containing protein [Sphingomonas citricola]MBW6522775.1 ferritin-like domain-containing protein [Sphingomonas citricola]
MIDPFKAIEILSAAENRRAARRGFLKAAGGGAVLLGGASLLSACKEDQNYPPTPQPTPTPTPTPTAVSDSDILNLALNLEYLEAQFYLYAVNGTGLSAAQTASGSGAAGGTVTGGAKVDFTGDPVVGAYAREIAADEAAHVAFLRTALGSAAVAMPNINIDGGANGAFTAAARAAGVIGASDTFNPYSSPENFLLGAFIFEDVGVTAYKGAAPLLSNKTYLEAAAGILAAESYHAGIVRTVLYAKGMSTTALITATTKISDARDLLDGTPTNDDIRGIGADDDQGLVGANNTANLVPANTNGLAYSRNSQQVHNIVYLNATGANRTGGGFFPNGTNNPNASLRVGLS